MHFRTVPVALEIDGKPVWKGDVEEFHLSRCPQARKCYGWVDGSNSQHHTVVILAIPPVDSPRKAVQKHMMDGASGA